MSRPPVSAEFVAKQYARALTDKISISGVRSGETITASDVRARISAYSGSPVAGVVLQGDQRAILLKSDLDDQGFPAPVKGDTLTVCDRQSTVWSVDQNTRKIGETIIAYELVVRGA